MSYEPKVYREQGGERQVIASGGSLDVESGGEIDIESGGALKIAGVQVTATAAQLNAATLAASATRTATAAGSITAADHGLTIFLDNATGFATALPAPIAGFKCEVISKTANTSGNHTIVSASSANIIKGNQNSVAGDAGDSSTADDTISFVANQSVAGDRVELRCDGTSWFAYATSRVAAGMTFTQAS